MAKELTENQKKAKSILGILKSFFSIQKREIHAIRVIAGTQKFWCRNPETIRYWKSLAEKSSLTALKHDTSVGVRVTKVIYK